MPGELGVGRRFNKSSPTLATNRTETRSRTTPPSFLIAGSGRSGFALIKMCFRMRPGCRHAIFGKSNLFSGFPIQLVLFEVGVHGGAHGGVEACGTETVEQFETLQLVLDRILHFREAHFDARFAQG